MKPTYGWWRAGGLVDLDNSEMWKCISELEWLAADTSQSKMQPRQQLKQVLVKMKRLLSPNPLDMV